MCCIPSVWLFCSLAQTSHVQSCPYSFQADFRCLKINIEVFPSPPKYLLRAHEHETKITRQPLVYTTWAYHASISSNQSRVLRQVPKGNVGIEKDIIVPHVHKLRHARKENEPKV